MQSATATRNLPSSRLWFVDYLRVFLTVLVIAHHAAQPYGPTEGRWLIFNPERTEFLEAFFPVNAAFFMGLFFLISGYFLPAAYQRKGATNFLKDRLLRLGVPILFFSLIVFPPILYLVEPRQVNFIQFWVQIYLRQGQLELGHLWFLAHLLVYAIGYSVVQALVGKPQKIAKQRKLSPPSHKLILIYLIGLAIASFIVRIYYPIDAWEKLFGMIPAEVAHLPQYFSLFIIGIIAYQHDWLRQMPTQRGLLWLWVGLEAASLRYFYTFTHRFLSVQLTAGGGLDWRSLLWSFWEATICIGFCVGLLVLFRETVNRQEKWLQILSENAYTVYLIHLVVVLAVQFSFATISIHPFIKFIWVTLISTLLCFSVSHFLRKLPFLKAIL